MIFHVGMGKGRARHVATRDGFHRCPECGCWVVRGQGDWWTWPEDRLPGTLTGYRGWKRS